MASRPATVNVGDTVPEAVKQRLTSCEYRALERCLEANNRDITKCEEQVKEFQISCTKPLRKDNGTVTAVSVRDTC